MNKNIISVKNLTKVFNDNKYAINNITTSFKKGEVTCIIGSSGSGKSTLLRTLNLMEIPTCGNIYYNNKSILDKSFDLKTYRTKVGMVFQNFNLFKHLTVLDNLNLAQILALNKTREDATTTSLKLLDKVGLLEYKDEYPHTLSGGQSQRVAIARALVMNPEVILFDEPTSALDPLMTLEVLNVMKELSHDNITMIIVTHELEFVKAFSNRVIVMDSGVIIEDDNTTNIFNNPKEDITKKLIYSKLI